MMIRTAPIRRGDKLYPPIDPVNKHPLLYNGTIPISYIRNYIDKIQFTIDYSSQAYLLVKSMFDGEFQDKKTFKVKTRLIHQYSAGSSLVQLVEYQKKFRFSVVLHDPDESSQAIIRDMLFNLPVSSVTIKQVEFAWDFYPELLSDLCLLFYNINQRLNLTYSRPNSAKTFFGNGTYTKYQGKDGNIHDGTKSKRVYLRPYCKHKPKHPKYRYVEPKCVHVELQANRGLCERLGLDLASLPIEAKMVPFSKHFVFRESLTDVELEKLVNAVSKKHPARNQLTKKTEAQQSKSKLGGIAEQRIKIRREIIETVLLPANCWKPQTDRQPVDGQIDGYKKIKEKYGLSYQSDKFFPKAKSSLFQRRLNNGSSMSGM